MESPKYYVRVIRSLDDWDIPEPLNETPIPKGKFKELIGKDSFWDQFKNL